MPDTSVRRALSLGASRTVRRIATTGSRTEPSLLDNEFPRTAASDGREVNEENKGARLNGPPLFPLFPSFASVEAGCSAAGEKTLRPRPKNCERSVSYDAS